MNGIVIRPCAGFEELSACVQLQMDVWGYGGCSHGGAGDHRLTSVALQKRLSKGRLSRHGKRTWLQWSLQVMILTFGSLPRGVPAQEETTPTGERFASMNGRQLGELLRKEIDAMDALLDGCRRKFGMERVAIHPFLGPLRVDQWRRFHVVHGHHRLDQLRLVIEQVAPARVPLQITNNNLVRDLQIVRDPF